jgi:hypothetical protein
VRSGRLGCPADQDRAVYAGVSVVLLAFGASRSCSPSPSPQSQQRGWATVPIPSRPHSRGDRDHIRPLVWYANRGRLALLRQWTSTPVVSKCLDSPERQSQRPNNTTTQPARWSARVPMSSAERSEDEIVPGGSSRASRPDVRCGSKTVMLAASKSRPK